MTADRRYTGTPCECGDAFCAGCANADVARECRACGYVFTVTFRSAKCPKCVTKRLAASQAATKDASKPTS
jgi:hypothetical protein